MDRNRDCASVLCQIMETGTEDRKMRRKHRNHASSFMAKVAVGAAKRIVRGTRLMAGSCPGKIAAWLTTPTEIPALLPAVAAFIPMVRPGGPFEEHS